jgi:hypothetical protein
MIARLPQSSLSSESSESESELEEEEEGFDGLCGAKRANMSTSDELVEMLREKERTIKKLQAEVHSLRNKSRPNKKDIRERMKWSGEEINFADSVNTGTSSSGEGGRTTSETKEIACLLCACADSHFLRVARRRIFGRG